LEDGGTITADRVVIALGFSHFPHVPEELVDGLPPDRFSHTCDLVDFAPLRGKRCLIVGGRQSALEWAALIHEAGAAAVHVCHRHPTPAFEEADWSWVMPLVDRIPADPGWFRRLSDDEKEALNRRLWTEGRLKVEPWLGPRLAHESVRLWPDSRIVAFALGADGDLDVTLDSGSRLRVDHVVFATGYAVGIERIPLLARGNLLERMRTEDGYPVLDESFQTSVPGLFFTSMPATRDFGPFFAFTVSVRASATVIGRALETGLRGPSPVRSASVP
ncbi:MAG TPA: NAD(P)-binding domain-containing protein, partial [Longimicrobiales bacterium]|nr:NAD(P)-binding domain-containing protein [Longimicrobiales bacterium]